MPIFEFICARCGHEFEELVFDRQAKVKCPKCRASKVNKQLSVFAHKSDAGFTPSSGGSGCGGCSSSSCSGCGK